MDVDVQFVHHCVILMYNTWGPTCLWAELKPQTHKQADRIAYYSPGLVSRPGLEKNNTLESETLEWGWFWTSTKVVKDATVEQLQINIIKCPVVQVTNYPIIKPN